MDAKLNILFIEKEKFYFSNGNGIFSCNYPEGSLIDLEVISTEAVKSAISKFIFENKFTAGGLIVILSDSICFREDLEILQEKDIETKLTEFKQSIPIDNILAKSYKIQNNVRFVAANKDITDIVIDQFLLNGFSLISLLPASLLPGVSNKISLDDEIIQTIGSTIDNVKLANMFDRQNSLNTKSVGEDTMPVQGEKSKLPYLLGVFVVLLGILIFYLLTTK